MGVSFHIGSDAKDPNSFDRAIRSSREAFDAGLDAGHDMRILDIGGWILGPQLRRNGKLYPAIYQEAFSRYQC